jgi:hypothetical protein
MSITRLRILVCEQRKAVYGWNYRGEIPEGLKQLTLPKVPIHVKLSIDLLKIKEKVFNTFSFILLCLATHALE